MRVVAKTEVLSWLWFWCMFCKIIRLWSLYELGKGLLPSYPTLQLLSSIRYRQQGHSFLPNVTDFSDLECKLKKKQNLYTPKIDEDKGKISWLGTNRIFLKILTQYLSLLGIHEILFENLNHSYWKCAKNLVEISKRWILERGENKEISLEKLWPEGHMLSKEKIRDLKELLQFLPSTDQQDYSFLENVAQSYFVDDVDGSRWAWNNFYLGESQHHFLPSTCII